MRPRVIIIQSPVGKDGRPLFDFKAAERYGELVVLMDNDNLILAPDIFLEKLKERLDELAFDSDRDYIMTTGADPVIFYVGLYLGCHYDRVRILRWVQSAQKYQPLTLSSEIIIDHGQN